MRKAVETNGLTAVGIDLGGTTHVTLSLLHRESSQVALSLTTMSVKHTLRKLSTAKVFGGKFWCTTFLVKFSPDLHPFSLRLLTLENMTCFAICSSLKPLYMALRCR